MEWIDIASLLFSAVAANHLGLVKAIETVIGRSLIIVNCARCLSFWSVLIFTLATGWNPVEAVAVSFLCAYAATWLQLAMAIIDNQFGKIYDTIYPTADTADD
jgi:hypothetical protein